MKDIHLRQQMENETAAKLTPILKELNEIYKGFFDIKFITIVDLDGLPDDIQQLRVICGAKSIQDLPNEVI